MKRELWRVTTAYACGGIIVELGVVVETAPIFRWMFGKTLEEVRRWKCGTFEKVGA